MADTIAGDTSTSASISSADVSFFSSAIDTAGDTDWIRATLDAGYGYQIWLQGVDAAQGTLADPLLAIRNSGGTQVAFNDNQSLATLDSFLYFTPSAGGTYYFDAQAHSAGATGTYTLVLERDVLASTASAATATVNGVTNGQVGFGVDTADWIAVTLTSGVNYQFDLAGSASDGTSTLADPWLALRDASGVLLASDDDSGVGKNARVFYTPTTTGVYYLDAEESGVDASGTYALIVNATPVLTPLTAGVGTAGTIAFAGDTNLYGIELAAGTTYSLSVTGDTLANPYLELLDGVGAVVRFNDNTNVFNPLITFTPTASGTYYAAVRDSGNNSTGTFHVVATAGATTPMIEGDAGANPLSGTAGADIIAGKGGNDTLTGGAGNDILDGGAGRDTANFSATRSSYALDNTDADLFVGGPDGTDALRGIERLHFSDSSLAFDIDGNAGAIARGLGVLFGAASVQVPQYVGIGISAMDSGYSYQQVLAAAIDIRLGANHTHADFVNAVYYNLVGSLPTPDVVQLFVGLLNAGTYTEVTLADAASSTDYNLDNIDYAGLFQTGLAFV